MSVLVGFLIVAIAAATIISVTVFVVREKHDHEEYYVPGQTPEMLADKNVEKQ